MATEKSFGCRFANTEKCADSCFKCELFHRDYISREAAIEALCKAHSPYPRRREISVRAIQEIYPADVGAVVRGHWQERHEHRWKKYEGTDEIDTFAGVDYGFHNGPLCIKCGLSFCEHCEPEKYLSVCPVPHYKCSICGHEADTNSPFCSNCGADMRPEKEDRGMIRKICGNCTSFEKPVLDCLQGKCHGFGKQTIDRFALEDACASFLPINEQRNCAEEGGGEDGQ